MVENAITEKTKELLIELGRVGYEKITVLCRDKRVPKSISIQSGAWFGDMPWQGKTTPIRVICASPQQLGEIPEFKKVGGNWPLLWGVVNRLGLTAGMLWGGTGNGDAHNINSALLETLTPGYYETKDFIE